MHIGKPIALYIRSGPPSTWILYPKEEIPVVKPVPKRVSNAKGGIYVSSPLKYPLKKPSLSPVSLSETKRLKRVLTSSSRIYKLTGNQKYYDQNKR